MQLYTVILKQTHMVSCFDAKGVKISDETKEIEVKICDMPLATAQMYRTTSAPGTVEIIKQSLSIDNDRRGDTRRTSYQHKPAAKIAKPAATPVESAAARAARTGDMTAAINKVA